MFPPKLKGECGAGYLSRAAALLQIALLSTQQVADETQWKQCGYYMDTSPVKINGQRASTHQPAGPFPGFLHFAVGSFPEGFQKLVPVLQVVLVVVSLHRLFFHGSLGRGSAVIIIGEKSPQRRPTASCNPAGMYAVHPGSLLSLGVFSDVCV